MDDVLENLCEVWVEFLNETHGTNVKLEEIEYWDMLKAFTTITLDDLYKPLMTEALWKRVEPLDGAVEYTKKLIEDGHKLVVVTASHPETVEMKFRNVLFKYFPFFTYKDVIITSQKQLIKGDVLIDDGIHNVRGGEYFGILFTAPHNKKYKIIENGVVRANSWEEVYEIIKNVERRLCG